MCPGGTREMPRCQSTADTKEKDRDLDSCKKALQWSQTSISGYCCTEAVDLQRMTTAALLEARQRTIKRIN